MAIIKAKIAAAVVAALLLGTVATTVMVERVRGQQDAPGQLPATRPTLLHLNDLDEGQTDVAIDLDTGALISYPTDFRQMNALQRDQWIAHSNVDLLAENARSRWSLCGCNLTLSLLRPNQSQQPTDAQLRQALAAGQPNIETMSMENGTLTAYLLPAKPTPPYVFAFRTSAGHVGVLQIEGLYENRNPKQIEFTYRLLPQRLQLRWVARTPEETAAAERMTQLQPGRQPAELELAVMKEVLLDETAVANATVQPPAQGRENSGWLVGFEFTPSGSQRFADLTGANINRQLAIVVDGKLVSAPVIRSRIMGSGQISGPFTRQEAEAIAAALNGAQTRPATP